VAAITQTNNTTKTTMTRYLYKSTIKKTLIIALYILLTQKNCWLPKKMTSDTIKKVFDSLKETEPQTPKEIADTTGLNQKTVQTILLELTLKHSDVKYKKIGRHRVFWKARKKE